MFLRAPTLIIAAFLLVGCATPRGDESASREELRRLEARLAELESRAGPSAPAAAPGGHEQLDPRQQPQAALDLLQSGNAAFAAGRSRPADLTPARVHELAAGQKPFAVIIGCADSRTPPEHLFNAGLGDLFVVRCAGNVVDDTVEASVEYAVAHLGCRLVVVLGHTSCGAVKATIADAKDTPAVAGLVGRIRPAVETSRRDGGDADLADRAASANAGVQRTSMLRDSSYLAGLERSGALKVATARYDLSDGTVDWIDADGLQIMVAPSAPKEAPARPATAPAAGHGH